MIRPSKKYLKIYFIRKKNSAFPSLHFLDLDKLEIESMKNIVACKAPLKVSFSDPGCWKLVSR